MCLTPISGSNSGIRFIESNSWESWNRNSVIKTMLIINLRIGWFICRLRIIYLNRGWRKDTPLHLLLIIRLLLLRKNKGLLIEQIKCYQERIVKRTIQLLIVGIGQIGLWIMFTILLRIVMCMKLLSMESEVLLIKILNKIVL